MIVLSYISNTTFSLHTVFHTHCYLNRTNIVFTLVLGIIDYPCLRYQFNLLLDVSQCTVKVTEKVPWVILPLTFPVFLWEAPGFWENCSKPTMFVLNQGT